MTDVTTRTKRGGLSSRGRLGRSKPYARRASAPDGSWKHDLAPSAPSAPSRKEEDSDRITVSNLHYEVMASDLKAIFESIGNLAREPHIRYDRSGRSLGVATVVFTNPRDALMAKTRLDGVSAKGKPMSIEIEQRPNIAKSGPRGPGGNSSLINRIASAPLLQRIQQASGPNVESPPQPQPSSRTQRNTNTTATGSSSSRAPKGPKATKPHQNKPKTAEDLDRELEAYLGNDNNTNGAASMATGDVEMS